MARPRIELSEKDWEQVDKMCAIFCTGEEIADVIGVSYDTLERRVKETFDMSCADYIKSKSSLGRMSLRRFQYTSAKKGNATMQIWLGKQYLNQTDKAFSAEDIAQAITLNYKLDDDELDTDIKSV